MVRMMWRIGLRGAAGLALLCTISVPAFAQETTTYTYDAKGRVTGVARSGGPSGAAPITCNGAPSTGICTVYAYDKADNRTNVTVTGSNNGTGGGSGGGVSGGGASPPVYVVVPLNGYTLIVAQQ